MPHKKLKRGFYDVEQIVSKRKRRNELYYLVKWQGYNSDYNTWEPAHNLQNVQDLIDQYESKEQDRQDMRKIFEEEVQEKKHQQEVNIINLDSNNEEKEPEQPQNQITTHQQIPSVTQQKEVQDQEEQYYEDSPLNQKNIYIVEKILNRRKIGKKIEYQIKWQNFPISKST
eukprot:TRINITY_DN49343_c0_g1_i1.p1 TRINITY_DN49343_c0_g1~~TRINITY_DN49343_c0_g1_i1.p1  ORF type:complete len:171 (-),score=20.08 TRINITY_DN49343_c0_g1_i1:127-639(-)